MMSNARALHHLGARERAIELADESLRLARRTNDSTTLADVLGFVNGIYQGLYPVLRLAIVKELLVNATNLENRAIAYIWQVIDQVVGVYGRAQSTQRSLADHSQTSTPVLQRCSQFVLRHVSTAERASTRASPGRSLKHGNWAVQ